MLECQTFGKTQRSRIKVYSNSPGGAAARSLGRQPLDGGPRWCLLALPPRPPPQVRASPGLGAAAGVEDDGRCGASWTPTGRIGISARFASVRRPTPPETSEPRAV